MRTGGVERLEAYLSAKSEKKEKNSRFSQPDVHRRGAFGYKEKAYQRQKKTFRLMQEIMKKKGKITRSSDFRRVFQAGKSLATRNIVLYYRKNQLNESRVGFIVSKKLGNAVKRNRVKRVLREGYRHLAGKIISGYDMVFVARFRAVTLPAGQAGAEMEQLLLKGGLLKADSR